MRNISVALTQPQILARTKTVTRRVGWLWLVEAFAEEPDYFCLLQPVEKGQGIPKGGHITPVGGPIRVLGARREMLDEVIVSPEYGTLECEAEGFPNLTPTEFVHFFCKTHPSTVPTSEITRIQFEYT